MWASFCCCQYLFFCADIFVESLEGINVELHKLPEQIKVALQDISGLAAAVDDAEEDVLQIKDRIRWCRHSTETKNSTTQERHFYLQQASLQQKHLVCIWCGPSEEALNSSGLPEPSEGTYVTMTYVAFQNTFNQIFKNPASHLKEESGGSLFITARSRVRSPFLPSHTKLLKDTTHQTDCDIVKKWCILACELLFHSEHYLSVFTRASTSGMFAFKEMALNSFISWAFKSRYLFLRIK